MKLNMSSSTRIIYIIKLKGGLNLKVSKIASISLDILKEIVLNSTSITNVLREIGYTNPRSGRNRSELKRRLISEKIDFSHFDGSKRNSSNSKLPLDEILVENSTYTSIHRLKNRLINEGYLEYKCEKCGNIGEWNGVPLSLHLDHKNGVNNDHRIENLRFLCPNCHSQTETYAGKNMEKAQNVKPVKITKVEIPKDTTIYKCANCGIKISGKGKSGLCLKCFNEKSIKVEKPSKEELIKLIKCNSFLELGRQFSVSDNTIRNWCKSYGMDYKKIKD